MTLPAYKATGTQSETAPAWPTHVAGDFGLLIAETTSSQIADPSGWSLITPTPLTNVGASSRLHLWRKFAASNAESAPSITGATNHAVGQIITYTGVNTLNPIHQISTGNCSSRSTHASPGMTTYIDDCLIVLVLTWALDNAGPLFTSYTNTTLASISAVRHDGGTTTGDGGGIIVCDATKVSQGEIVDGVWTISTNSFAGMATIALWPADKNYGTKSREVNTRM